MWIASAKHLVSLEIAYASFVIEPNPVGTIKDHCYHQKSAA